MKIRAAKPSIWAKPKRRSSTQALRLAADLRRTGKRSGARSVLGAVRKGLTTKPDLP